MAIESWIVQGLPGNDNDRRWKVDWHGMRP